jgi:hypothetical protein
MKLPGSDLFKLGVEIMSDCPQRKLRLFFAASREASQIDDPPKDRWRNVMFPLDI